MLNSTFRQLQVFVVVVEAGSFAKAADQLNVSQPGISRHIKALENQCGGLLLCRTPGQKTRLTALGQALYEHAPSLVEEARILNRKLLVARAQRPALPVRVSGHPYVMEHVIRPLLGDFLASSPLSEIEIAPLSQDVIHRRTGMLTCDIAFMMTARPDEPDLEYLSPLECGLFVGGSHPLAARAGLTLAELCRSMFVLPLAGSSFEEAVLSILDGIGCRGFAVAARAQQIDVIKDLVLRGAGVVHMPLGLVRGELRSGALVRLPFELPSCYLGQLAAAATRANPQALALLSFVRTAFGKAGVGALPLPDRGGVAGARP